MTLPPYDAVVLAGGAARRLGGVDKPSLEVGGASLLERVLAAVAAAGRTVVVGPPRPLPSQVVQVREQPAGGGPGAALVAGLPHVTAPAVAVLAADLPGISPLVVEALRRTADGRDGEVLVDDGGHDQVLTAVWSTAALREALQGEDLTDRALRPFLRDLDVARLPAADAGVPDWADCDTPEDLARARESAPVSDLDDWTARAAAELGIDDLPPLKLLLDLSRQAAHGVVRPAAPVTTYLLGVAVGRGADLTESAARLAALLPPEEPPP